jgi:hypothetical protein
MVAAQAEPKSADEIRAQTSAAIKFTIGEADRGRSSDEAVHERLAAEEKNADKLLSRLAGGKLNREAA